MVSLAHKSRKLSRSDAIMFHLSARIFPKKTRVYGICDRSAPARRRKQYFILDEVCTNPSTRKKHMTGAVSLPANDATEISARTFGDGLIAEIRAERLKAEERAHKLKALRLRTRLWGEKTSEKE